MCRRRERNAVKVKSVQESDSQVERREKPHGGNARRQGLTLALLLVLTTALLLVVMLGAHASTGSVDASSASAATLTSLDFNAAPNAAPQDYSKFSHTSPGAHAGFSSPASCANCHQRNGTQTTPSYPGHKACISCHLTQFTTANIQMCTICHVNDLGNTNPALKAFPRLRSFRVSYDHQQHIRAGAACATCHKPARGGVALTAPVDLNAHKVCYSCHSPGASASNLSACGTCHSVGGYALSTPGARAYSASFSHATHGPRQRLNCTDCHTVLRSGLPPTKQVASPATFQHFAKSRAQSCLTCHNGQRAFGDKDFGDCRRCHKGATFRMGG